MKNLKKIIFLLVFLIAFPCALIWENPAQYVAKNTSLLLYVKDFPHLEDNLRQAALTPLYKRVGLLSSQERTPVE